MPNCKICHAVKTRVDSNGNCKECREPNNERNEITETDDGHIDTRNNDLGSIIERMSHVEYIINSFKPEISQITDSKDLLITKLIEEVQFLRQQVIKIQDDCSKREQSLMKIIEMISPQQINELSNYQTTEWQNPKYPVRNRFSNKLNTDSIKLYNRYNILSSDEDNIPIENEDNNKKEQRYKYRKSNATHNQNNRKNNANEQNKDDLVNENDSREFENNQPEKKKIFIIGDSLTKELKGYKMSKIHRVSCFSISGGNIEEMVHFCRALCSRKPNEIIIHCGTNLLYRRDCDIQPDVKEVIENYKSLVDTIDNEFPDIKITLSNVVERNDRGEEGLQRITDFNELLNLDVHDVIKHDNINRDHLNNLKVHLNKTGNTIFAQNFIKYLRQ